MTRPHRGAESFGARYLRSLTGVNAAQVVEIGWRAPKAAGFWRRYWASLTGVSWTAVVDRSPAEGLVAELSAIAARRPAVTRPDGSGWLELPRVLEPATLAAGDDDAVIMRTGSPDGTLDLLLHRSGDGPAYSLEVVLRTGRFPLVVAVRYGTGPGRPPRSLLVPVTAALVGPAASEVRLDAFDPAAPWEAHTAVGPDEVADWNAEMVGASVDAAATQATMQAWREMQPLVPEPARQLIAERLR